MNVITLDKIVQSYFACVAREPFTYKGKAYEPKPLTVSAGIFKDFTCVPHCGACCGRFSLDYLPGEVKAISADTAAKQDLLSKLQRIEVQFNGLPYLLWRHTQVATPENRFCDYLNRENAQCNVHGSQPFSCDFETLRFSVHSKGSNHLNNRPYGRAWAMLRVLDLERGALCEFTPVDQMTPDERVMWTAEASLKLMRLRQWARHFDLKTCLDEVIEWVQAGPHAEPLRIDV